ncbi:flavin prenyltransferase UbiX [Paenibacillus sp. FSL H7-0942]|jgi:4-hydroxy-3-polyprenylbenzoate decarboxylase|uniref:Flavin prenyltransferase UbiX n=1 Tax=Paenibacillus xylanexedens TaxID=528191 RepID=A0ABS4RXC9_PAEXY|nr:MULTISPECIES: flavin prenyltransferase UbiX [Paenibacillus]UOK61765.1 UbiX family flavin prenyltransferase [Paenibacillus sp. OVF10]KLU55390.1 aromatic acid decarboxylase [Paenibacillus sp. VT-400]MBD8836377.1 UbiX family flavin prenyltransferase [Paenibacillus sp. CFBP 13594]MBP2246990.1 4-hydroxy-3-polyprenylbenzoate decarboxylase [Paenibacillus xylanexedens]MCL6661444.1 UbiX family flavin prenyltransferase [Paenibacillus amylolyticus]
MVQQPDNKRLVVGITGASGSIYGIRLIETLLDLEYNVHLVISNAGWRVLKEELDWDVTNRDAVLEEKFGNRAGSLIYHPVSDIGASIASGSYLADGMIIMPCSMGTLSSIAQGSSDNLMSRAADVMMKEGRTLILVPRETPLHAIHLENMLKLSRLGVRMIPAMPAFYYKPQTMDELILFLVGKVLDSLRIPHQLFTRWGEPDERG